MMTPHRTAHGARTPLQYQDGPVLSLAEDSNLKIKKPDLIGLFLSNIFYQIFGAACYVCAISQAIISSTFIEQFN